VTEENIELVRRACESFNAQELDLELFDPDIEVDNSVADFDAAVYRGHDGVREWLSLIRAMWKSQRIEPQEFIPVGEDRVVVPVRIQSVGRAEVETVAYAATVWTLREGRIAGVRRFRSKEDALEAAGGPE
jgi:ketosteroid isomerase-like protein